MLEPQGLRLSTHIASTSGHGHQLPTVPITSNTLVVAETRFTEWPDFTASGSNSGRANHQQHVCQ
jgi:hypothetical protein